MVLTHFTTRTHIVPTDRHTHTLARFTSLLLYPLLLFLHLLLFLRYTTPSKIASLHKAYLRSYVLFVFTLLAAAREQN